MISGYFVKHPDATKTYDFDFEDDIPENDDLNSYTATAVDSEGVDHTDDIIVGASQVSPILTLTFSGGDDGNNYRITVIATLENSSVTPVRIVEMRVRSKEIA